MSLNNVFCVFTLLAFVHANDITFKKVTLSGYGTQTENGKAFEVEIASSSNLKENIPENAEYYKLEIQNSSIPILYENSITDIEKVKEFTLSFNEITEIKSGAFKNLPNLHTIDLSNNKLEEIKEGVFNGLPLKIIKLGFNLIKSIDSKAFDNMLKLEGVQVNNNKLTFYDANWFANTPELHWINFDENLLETLPAKTFHNTANKAGKLGTVYFNENKIKNLHPKVFEGAVDINTIELGANELETINANIFEGIKIDTILAGENKLKCINGDLDKLFLNCNAVLIELNEGRWNTECLVHINKWKAGLNGTYSLTISDESLMWMI